MNLADLHFRLHCRPLFRVLGQELEPLTLGHVERLESLGVLRAETPAALAVCVLICCQRLHEFDRMMESRWLNVKLWLWALRLRVWDFDAHQAAWATYYIHHAEMPAVDFKKGQGTSSPTPFTRHLRVVLMSELGYSRSELSDVPYAEALWDYYAYGEYAGRNTINDESVIDRRRDMAASENAEDAEELIQRTLCRS